MAESEFEAFGELPGTVQLDVLNGDLVQIGIFVKTQTGEIHSLHVHPNESVDGPIENVVDILSGCHLQLFFQGKKLQQGKNLTTDYGIYDQCIIDMEELNVEEYLCNYHPRKFLGWGSGMVSPKAWAVVLFDWDGEMKYPGFYGLRLERGMVIVITRIITPLWCEGYDPGKYFERVSMFPFCYVQITQFDDASFRDEFINISGFADWDLPPLSQSDYLPIQPFWWQLPLQSTEAANERKMEETLKSIIGDVPRIIQATMGPNAPPLPIFPYPDPDPVFFKVHAGRKALTFIQLALKCNPLSSPGDTPSLSIVLSCFSEHPMRISSVTFSLAFHKNQISYLLPRDISGPETEVNALHTESKSIGLQSGAAVGTQNQGISVSGNWSRSVEDTRTTIYHTQVRIQGLISGGNTAN